MEHHLVRFDILKPVFSLPVEPLTTFTKSFWQASPVKNLKRKWLLAWETCLSDSVVGACWSWTIFKQTFMAQDAVRMKVIENPHNCLRPTIRKGGIYRKHGEEYHQTCSWLQTSLTVQPMELTQQFHMYRLFLYKSIVLVILVCCSGRDTQISGCAGDCYTTSFRELDVRSVEIISIISMEKILRSFPTKWYHVLPVSAPDLSNLFPARCLHFRGLCAIID